MRGHLNSALVANPTNPPQGDHRIRQGGEGMVSGSQQDAAQPHAIAGYWKRDDLTAAVRKILVTARPASLKNEGLVSCLPFLDELPAALHCELR